MQNRESLKVLLIEEDPREAARIGELLGSARAVGCEVTHAAGLSLALEAVAGQGFDVAVLCLAQGSHISAASCTPYADAVALVHRASPGLPIVVLSAREEDAAEVDAMAAGAMDCLARSQVDANLLGRSVRYAVQRKRAEENVRRLVREQMARAQAEAAERRARFLADAGRKLADSLDYDATLALAARLGVAMFADVCIVDVAEDSGIRRASIAHARADLEPAAQALLAFAPLVPGAEDVTASVLANGEAVLVPELTGEAIARGARSPEHLAVLRAIAPTSLLVVPMLARGRTLGAMTLLSTSPERRYTSEDLGFALELSGRAALSVDNAKLYRARDDMLAVVSHDLRNPLNVIGFAVASLRRDGVSHEQRGAHLEKIRRASDRMNRLIEDLLDVSRLEGGSFPIDRGPQPAGALIGDICEQMRTIAEERSVRLSSELAAALPPVHADRERILQVFSNLVGNALKFTPAGGTITIGAAARGDVVRFRVADTGPGIPDCDLLRIFDRFWQAKRRDRSGAGLGLAIARGIVAAHDGRIWAESVLGEGATFLVELPVAALGAGSVRRVARDE